MKHCVNCRQDKAVLEFNKDREKKDGLQSYCRSCSNKLRKQRRNRMRKRCEVRGPDGTRCESVGFTDKGMCSMHYGRFRKTGDPGPPGKLPKKRNHCSVENCPRRHYAKGWCHLHHNRVFRTGSPGPLLPFTPRRECLVPRCERKHRARGLCDMHYQRWYDTGKIGPAVPKPKRFSRCTHPLCDGKHYCKGLCKIHYRKMRYETIEKPRRVAA